MANPVIARIIGGAGTGKTTELMRLLDLVLSRGIDPFQVGFVTFTRAARREASSRAADRAGATFEQLERDGWFRTLHSVCFKALGMTKNQVLGDERETNKWLRDHLGDAGSRGFGGADVDDADDSDAVDSFSATTDVGRALAIWGAARNRLEPLLAAWKRVDRCSDRTPSYERISRIVADYEQAKRLDNKIDFVDLLGRFAGYDFGVDGHERGEEHGESPDLPVWFFDEQQDTSALLDAVCHRLIGSPRCKWVYVVGDPFQAIYGWSGADARLFQAWPAANQRIMPRSYRCPAPIHNFGERILTHCSDYWDRGIQPAPHPGDLSIEHMDQTLIRKVDPTQSWLLLARTNRLASGLGKRLDDEGIPWQPTQGMMGGWNRPKQNLVFNAVYDLSEQMMISVAELKALVAAFPAKGIQGDIFDRGMKSAWAKITQEDIKRSTPKLFELLGPAILESEANVAQRNEKASVQFSPLIDMPYIGKAIPGLANIIKDGTWVEYLKGGREYRHARRKHGYAACHDPSVRVGTIHSVKGAEADNVLWLTTTSRAVVAACEDRDGFDEECKVSYVAATRARGRLVVAIDLNQAGQQWTAGIHR